MRLYLLLLFLIPLSHSFTVLPYIQIDYAHYFRLAQCQSKCTEKYGIASKRELLDGSIEEYLDRQSDDHQMCELGCQQNRRQKSKISRSTGKAALLDGAKFWAESSADSAKIGSSPVSNVALLCQNSANTEEFEDSSEGLIGVRLVRPLGASRFIVQWKQRTVALGFYDESQWITASIEADTVFPVEGLIPGVQYRFMITVVGPTGRLGDTVISEWEESAISTNIKSAVGPLSVKNGFNTEHGVTSSIEWNRSSYLSCYYRLQYSNSTHQVSEKFSLDASPFYLLKNLQFDSQYTLSLSSISSLKDDSLSSKPLYAQFTSFQCRQVYGPGSLHCRPEPVEDLKVIVRHNGTALISWKASADISSVLTYQISYQSITQSQQCPTEPVNIYLKASMTSSEIVLSPSADCEYLIRLINYDTLGRDATAEARVSFYPTHRLSFPLESIIIISFVVLLLLLCIIIKCRFSRKCPVRVSEKQEKLTDYA